MIQAVKEGGQLEYLLSCRWCASVHVGFLVAAIVVGTSPQLHPDTTTTLVLVGLLTLAYSQFTGERAAAEVEV